MQIADYAKGRMHHLVELWKLAGTENRRNNVLIILRVKWLIKQGLLSIRRMCHNKWNQVFKWTKWKTAFKKFEGIWCP